MDNVIVFKKKRLYKLYQRIDVGTGLGNRTGVGIRDGAYKRMSMCRPGVSYPTRGCQTRTISDPTRVYLTSHQSY